MPRPESLLECKGLVFSEIVHKIASMCKCAFSDVSVHGFHQIFEEFFDPQNTTYCIGYLFE